MLPLTSWKNGVRKHRILLPSSSFFLISVVIVVILLLDGLGLHREFAPSSVAAASPSTARSSESTTDYGSSIPLVLISLVVILMSAKLGGALMERIRQPAVLGELTFGVVVGNLPLLGFHQL